MEVLAATVTVVVIVVAVVLRIAAASAAVLLRGCSAVFSPAVPLFAPLSTPPPLAVIAAR